MRQGICYSHQGELAVDRPVNVYSYHITRYESGTGAAHGGTANVEPVHTRCNGPCLCKRVQGESLAKYHTSHSLNDPRDRVVTVMTTGRQSADSIDIPTVRNGYFESSTTSMPFTEAIPAVGTKLRTILP
jgi:hypothetical protein